MKAECSCSIGNKTFSPCDKHNLLAQRDALLTAAKRFFEVADVQYADNFHDLKAAINLCSNDKMENVK